MKTLFYVYTVRKRKKSRQKIRKKYELLNRTKSQQNIRKNKNFTVYNLCACVKSVFDLRSNVHIGLFRLHENFTPDMKFQICLSDRYENHTDMSFVPGMSCKQRNTFNQEPILKKIVSNRFEFVSGLI